MKFSIVMQLTATVAAVALCVTSVVDALSTRNQHCLANQERVKRNMTALEFSPLLAKVAYDPSLDDRIYELEADSTLYYFSQSIGVGGRSDEEIVKMILDSPRLLEILMSKDWTHMGFGIARYRMSKVETCPAFAEPSVPRIPAA
ncbi:hypothetical protein BDF22DRAFT_691621 [Syncephalis plumigaleata]|nr:hypothetical protein BDF22DRAFT_691621 [Syncephalis plumigaleata]